MKKFKLLFLLAMPAILGGCIKYNGLDPTKKGGSSSGGGDQGQQGGDGSGDQTQSEVTVYLSLSKIGLYNGEKGNNIQEKFLENAITLTAAPGSTLPGSDVITSTNTNAEFVSWLCYEGKGAPTEYTTVPNENGKILYANFAASDERESEEDTEDSYVFTLNTALENGDGNWNTDNASIYAHVFNDTENEDILLTKSSDSYFTFTLDKDMSYTGVVFVRMEGGAELNWETKWNQTVDLEFDLNYREAQITNWDAGEGKSGVRWVR